VLIDRIVASSGASVVIELAAGLSRRGAAISADSSIQYLEFDLPNVTARKRSLLLRSPEGRAVAARANYEIHEADVLGDRWEEFVPNAGPRMIVAEGLLMYFRPNQRRELFVRAAACLRCTGGAFVFDLVPPNEQPKPGTVGRVLGWMMRRFTGGVGFEETEVTRESILADLKEAGFDSVEALEPYRIAEQWGLPFIGQRTTQLVFYAKRNQSSH
jgi:O-methyltransferase involved in polyketide biosynthesis